VRIGEASGSRNQREEIEALLAEQRELVAVPSSEHLTALISNSDIFVQLKDIPEEKRAFEDLPFEDWMLYLHPDQKALVHKRFNGPARLRGVSGSGKTVVAIHRVREAARNLVSAGSRDSVLFLTYNRSLCELVKFLHRDSELYLTVARLGRGRRRDSVGRRDHGGRLIGGTLRTGSLSTRSILP